MIALRTAYPICYLGFVSELHQAVACEQLPHLGRFISMEEYIFSRSVEGKKKQLGTHLGHQNSAR